MDTEYTDLILFTVSLLFAVVILGAIVAYLLFKEWQRKKELTKLTERALKEDVLLKAVHSFFSALIHRELHKAGTDPTNIIDTLSRIAQAAEDYASFLRSKIKINQGMQNGTQKPGTG